MKMSEVVGSNQIVHKLEGDKKEDVIKSLVALLEKGKKISEDDAAKVYRALLARERLGSTGIGRGVAVPHAKVDGVAKPIGAMALLAQPMDFAAIDGGPVDVVMLFLFPKEDPGAHLKVMGHVSGILRSTPFSQYARATKDRKALVELVKDAEDLRPAGGTS